MQGFRVFFCQGWKFKGFRVLGFRNLGGLGDLICRFAAKWLVSRALDAVVAVLGVTGAGEVTWIPY